MPEVGVILGNIVVGLMAAFFGLLLLGYVLHTLGLGPKRPNAPKLNRQPTIRLPGINYHAHLRQGVGYSSYGP